MAISRLIHDQHVHSRYSPDSAEDLETIVKQAIALGYSSVVTTDHFDYDCKYFKRDVVVDMPNYLAEVRQLQERYDIRLLKGLEVGYRADYHDRINEYLTGHPLDLVLLSVHNDGAMDFSTEPFATLPVNERFRVYLETLNTALEAMDNFDIVSHLDFFARYAGKDNPVLEADFIRHRTALYDALKTIIRKRKVLELNTTGLRYQGWIHPHPYVLRMYVELGGRLFSIGSDAHRAEHMGSGFEEAAELLRSFNIHEVVVFRDRIPELVSL